MGGEYDEPLASDWLFDARVSPLFVHLLCNSQSQAETECMMNLSPEWQEVFKMF